MGKRFSALALALMLVFALAGCAGTPPSSQPASASVPASAPASSSVPAAETRWQDTLAAAAAAAQPG